MSAVRGIDDLLPAAALAVALAALEEVKRQDLNDDMDENSPRVKLTRCPRKRRDSGCLLYTSPSPRDGLLSRMPSSA